MRSANIITDLFPPDLMAEVEELNRDFIRSFDQMRSPHPTPTPEHNIRFVEAKCLQAHHGQTDDQIYESPQALGDFQVSVVCLNQPVLGPSVKQPRLTAHIIYKGKNGEDLPRCDQGRVAGRIWGHHCFWIGQRKCLIVFLLTNQNTLKKLWNETYTTETSWMANGPLFRMGYEGIRGDITSITIDLLAHDTCVVRAVFEVKARREGELPMLVLQFDRRPYPRSRLSEILAQPSRQNRQC